MVRLNDITDLDAFRVYSERYINDGSPSGFTERFRTSPGTDPFGLVPFFHLYKLRGEAIWCTDVGDTTGIDQIAGHHSTVLHPDMVEHSDLTDMGQRVSYCEEPAVVPTGSARTVQLRGARTGDYVKLHYDAMLGRVNRALTMRKAIAGVEVSSLIGEAVTAGRLGSAFGLLPEVGARIIELPRADGTFAEWGLVYRSAAIQSSPRIRPFNHMFPFFSLFSVDRLASYHPTVLAQMAERSGRPASEIVLEELIPPLLEAYFSLLMNAGLQVEWNAQNVLVAVDDDFRVTGVVMRDCGEVEKDMTLRDSLGLTSRFRSAPYKCISLQDNPTLYRIRHSFAFDFKLGEYILDPLLLCAASVDSRDVSHLRVEVRRMVALYAAALPGDFFPSDGNWYWHDRIVLTGARPYIARENPKFR